MSKKATVKDGSIYDRWTILNEVSSDSTQRKFLCRCECGNEKVVFYNNLRSGGTKSCGCLRTEIIKAQSATRAKRVTRHTKCTTPWD